MALEKIFLSVSISVMGLVLSMFFPQSEVFGMGMMFALFHSFGVCFSIKILLKSLVIDRTTTGGEYFQHSYVILDGPAALLLGEFFMTETISSSVNGVLMLSKIPSLSRAR